MAYPGFKQPTGFEVGPPASPPSPPAGPLSRVSGEQSGGAKQCEAQYGTTLSAQAAQGSYAAAKEAAKKSQYPSK